jgi:hypothetical protein
MISASLSLSAKTRLPQAGQKWRPLWLDVGPSLLNAASGQMAKNANADPLVRLQSVQWQTPTRSGSPVTE